MRLGCGVGVGVGDGEGVGDGVGVEVGNSPGVHSAAGASGASSGPGKGTRSVALSCASSSFQKSIQSWFASSQAGWWSSQPSRSRKTCRSGSGGDRRGVRIGRGGWRDRLEVAAALAPDLARLGLDRQLAVGRIGLAGLEVRAHELGHRGGRELAGQQAAHRVDRDLGHAIGPGEVVDRQLVEGGDLGHVVVPDEGRAVGREDVLDRAEVAVADPHAGDDRPVRILGVVRVAGEVAVGLEVLEVVGRARLQRRRAPSAIGLELEARAPQRVRGRIGVVGEDVGDEMRRGGGQHLLAVAGIGGVVVDDVAVGVLDPLDHVRLHEPCRRWRSRRTRRPGRSGGCRACRA